MFLFSVFFFVFLFFFVFITRLCFIKNFVIFNFYHHSLLHIDNFSYTFSIFVIIINVLCAPFVWFWNYLYFLLVICLLCKFINFIKRPSYHPQSFFFQLVLCSTFHQHPPLLSEMIKVDVFYLPPSPLYLLSSQYNQINLYT